MRKPVASTPQPGNSYGDGVLGIMKRFGLPMTREQYIELAYLGEEPVEGAEFEESLPEQFRKR
jgi:hypothetical protein